MRIRVAGRRAGEWLAGAIAAAVLLAPAERVARAEADGGGRLEGTWRVTVIAQDCETGAPGLRFNALLSFARGGTVSGTTANPAFQPGQRTSDYGVWRATGDRTYRAVSEAFILFDAPAAPPVPPLFRGTQRITQAIHVSDDVFDSDATAQFLDTNRDVLAGLCATAVGTRMK